MAGEINVARYDANEILHKDDLQYGETRAYENLTSIIKRFLISTKDVILQGGIVKERGTPSMNVDIESLLAFCVSTGKFAYFGSDYGPVAITNGGAQARYDTLEIRLKETNFDELQRAYKDPNTGDITYQNWMTKIHYELEAQVILGVEGAGVAPSHTAGWIKIAEIFVDAGESTSILNADIKNADAGYDTEINSNWTAETDITFRTKALTEFKKIFRVKHKEDGDHLDDIIRAIHLDWGTGVGEVDSDLMPLGTDIVHAPTGGTDAGLTSASTVRQAVQKILDLLIDLSGVQNDALDSRHIAAGAIDSEHIANDQVDSQHYIADSIDAEHINFGIGAGQIDAVLLPIDDSSGYFIATEVESALKELYEHIRDTDFLPIGYIAMFDGTGWVDNSSIPGWYSCIAANAGQGCPDMVDRFVMGKVVVGAGSTGGSNTMIDHTHSCGDQSASHKHDTVMGTHRHIGLELQNDAGAGGASAARLTIATLGSNTDDLATSVTYADFVGGGNTYHRTIRTELEDLGTKESGDQKTSHSHSIGGGVAPGSTNSRPSYYSMIYIRKCA